MSLPDSPASLGPRWAPTHVQVTVLRARGLRSKAKGGSGGGGGGGGSDAYAVMALGKEKFATSVAERCLGSPVWREEATFELPPPPRRGLGGEGAAGRQLAVLQLTVFHRALLGLDKFLGRAELSLAELQNEGGRRTTRWYRLHSKPGKKEKERGEIEVDIQFMRSNMTASMFDLSMKDKSRNPFGKLKDKLKGKRGDGLPDTASAIIPSISHSPVDSEEESNGKEKKKSKFKTLFSKPGLQKSNLSQSMSVLPHLQPVSERVRLRPSDFQSKWGEDDDDDDSTLTPVSENPSARRAEDNLLYPPSGMSHKRTGSADSKQLSQITSSNTKKDGHSLFGGLKSKNDPTSRSNLCINGSHVYMEESRNDPIPRENPAACPSPSPSPSPQLFRRKQLSSSTENVPSGHSKELEGTGKVPPERGQPGSLESFKAMTLPSYKLLSGEDLPENSTPVILDTPKENKENKKQENKMSALRSLVTGKKETKKSEEVESNTETSLKVKEVKRNEKELARKETNPFEVPVDCKRDPAPDKSSAADALVANTPLNPFTENTRETEKTEKNAAPVKPSPSNPIKPRLGLSSEDETEATVSLPAPPLVSPFCPSHPSSNDNPFISELDQARETQGCDSFASPSLNLSAQHDNNPFTLKWKQESRGQGSECFTTTPVRLPSSSSANNPFASEFRVEDSENSTNSLPYFPHPPAPSVPVDPLESKREKDSERVNSPSTPSVFPSPSSSQKHNCSSESSGELKHLHHVASEKPQNQSLTSQTDPVSNLPGSLSGRFYDRIGLIVKAQCDNREVQVVPPFKENQGSVKKSVSFALEEPKENDATSSGDELSDADSDSSKGGQRDESEDAEEPAQRHGRRRCELDPSKLPDGNLVHYSGNPLERESETSTWGPVEAPVPTPRSLTVSTKETSMSEPMMGSCSLPKPPKPAPRSALNQKSLSLPLADKPATDAHATSSDSELRRQANSTEFTIVDPLATSTPTTLYPGRDGGAIELSLSVNNADVTGMQSSVLLTEELHRKPPGLPVIPEVGSDDELLSGLQHDQRAVPAGLAGPGDHSSALWTSIEEREPISSKNGTGEKPTALLCVKMAAPDESFETNAASASPLAVAFQDARNNIHRLKQKDDDNVDKERQNSDCPAFAKKPAFFPSLSNSCPPSSASSFQSDAVSSIRAETSKKASAEALDAKGEISGKKKLLQAWVSPSETHPNQTLPSGGAVSAKLRLHPVKPMNATANKPPAKALNATTKILDSNNETNLKKYDPSDPAYAYGQLTHDELIQLVLKQKGEITKRDLQVRELEDYIDNLLVRVMEETPNILRAQAQVNKKAGKMSDGASFGGRSLVLPK